MSKGITDIASLLIANRGEIAGRIARTCREHGIRTVGIFSDADRYALHTVLADEAYGIGGSAAADSYLDADKVIAAAQACGVDAIHPGYGFLAEDPTFAERVVDAGLRFVGPRAETIATMGDKVAARRLASGLDIPVLPGTSTLDPSGDIAAVADDIGYPLMVKAAAGGGGRGMRLVHGPDELSAAVESAAREAVAAFGSGALLFERYLRRARHIEVQVVGDEHGNVVHLGDRDCSIQRRHQKVLEEAPAPALGEVRDALADAAVTLAAAVGYVGVGTVEFLVSDEGWFFIEMNTRLQVEHGVTELVTGLDLVWLQLVVAAGKPLPIGQHKVDVRGHAIQARVTAEDPASGFLPSPGVVSRFVAPQGPWVRVDAAIGATGAIPAEYDSLVAKLLVWGPDRASSISRARRALTETVVDGVATNLHLLAFILEHEDFVSHRHVTSSLTDWPYAAPPAPVTAAPAAVPNGRGASRTVEIDTTGRRLVVDIYRPNGLVAAGRSPSSPSGRAARAAAGGAGGGTPAAPIDASVVAIRVANGDAVAIGDPLVVLEAMKMELVVSAERAGTVAEVLCEVGQHVGTGQPLIEIRSAADDDR